MEHFNLTGSAIKDIVMRAIDDLEVMGEADIGQVVMKLGYLF